MLRKNILIIIIIISACSDDDNNFDSPGNPRKNNLNSICITGSGMAFLVGDSGRIYSSQDTGLNWKIHQQAENFKNIDFLSLFFLDSNNGWIVGTQGRILKTNDGGNSWNIQNSGILTYLNSVF